MKKIFLFIILLSSITTAQKFPLVPQFWEVDETSNVIKPINHYWKILFDNVDIDKSDLGLDQVNNKPQIKKNFSSTNGTIPIWIGTAGDSLADGYTVGTDANQLVQLDGTAKLPPIDGSQLTALPEFILDCKILDGGNFSTNSTSYVDVTNLTYPLLVNTVYRVNGYVQLQGEVNEAELLINVPDSTYFNGYYDKTSSGTITRYPRYYILNKPTLVLSSTSDILTFELTIATKGISGNLSIQVKNNAGNTTTVNRGAYFTIQRTRQ